MDPTNLDVFSPDQIKVTELFESKGYDLFKHMAALTITTALMRISSVPLPILDRICFEQALKKERGPLSECEENELVVLLAARKLIHEISDVAYEYAKKGGLGQDILKSIRKAAEED
jgi:hypothetical protein